MKPRISASSNKCTGCATIFFACTNTFSCLSFGDERWGPNWPCRLESSWHTRKWLVFSRSVLGSVFRIALSLWPMVERGGLKQDVESQRKITLEAEIITSIIWKRRRGGVGVGVCWLLNVPATCWCISGTDLLRQVYILPHWEVADHTF